MSLLKNKPVEIKKPCYVMDSGTSSDDVEVTFYGDVVESRPWDFWNNCPVDGNFIILNDFLADLDRLSGFKNVVFRLNSFGGDSTSGIAIHNRIKEMKPHTVCIVDGVAMSAASIIAVACDTVKVNPASILMIHKNSCGLFGQYNADETAELVRMLEGYDKATASAYAKKTGLAEDELLRMMAETTYLTGKEAIDKGFADELIGEPVTMSASVDGKTIYLRNRAIHLAPGLFAPDNIPTKETTTPEPSVVAKNMPEVIGNTEGGVQMTKEELRSKYPELVAEIEADSAAALNNAVTSERDRLRAIDEIAGLFANELVNEAKYGESRCTAEQLSYRAAIAAQKQGKAFLAQLDDDTQAAQTNAVTSAPAPEEKPEDMMTDTEKQAQADALFKKLLAKN